MEVKTNIFQKSLVKDLHPNFQGTDVWSHARNALVHSDRGDMATIVTEPANKLCYSFSSTPLSQIKLKDDRLLIIQQSGEFGILNEASCTYEKLFKLDCEEYKFTCKPIKGESKIINNTEEYVVFGNSEMPVGEINLSKIPYKFTTNQDSTCLDKTFTKEVDCRQLFQFKDTTIPCLTVNTQNNKTGNLPNGTYSVAISYISNGEKSSSYYSLSTPLQIFNTNNNGSIQVSISNLAQNYEQYQLLLIVNTAFNGTENSGVNAESYYTYGPFNTSQRDVVISDISGFRETIDRIVTQNRVPKSVGNIVSNSEYLLYSDVSYSKPLDYQLQAMNITVEYVIKQVPLDYYKTNFNFGYYGDENYAPVIRWITTNGEISTHSHIPGRRKTGKDSSNALGDDVYELDGNLNICNKPIKLELWQVENTAGKFIAKKEQTICNETIIGSGKMGYFESSDLYPDDKERFGDSACTPIRYPKFPDECNVPRSEVIEGVTYINLKLWRFKNIEHPKDELGNYRTDIIGYEILRKSRDLGNKTVIATGYLSNIRGLVDQTRTILYQNYPYNDLSPDSFHSLNQVDSKKNREQNFKPLTTVYNDRFSFFTPDANYGLKTALGQELKIYTEEQADVKGKFEQVYKHPKAKLITNFSLYLASLLGLVQAYLEINGKVCKTTEKDALPIIPPTIINPNPQNKVLFEQCDSTWNKATTGLDDIRLGKFERTLLTALQTAAKALGFTLLAAQHAQIWLDIIQKLVAPRQYAYQYNSVAKFSRSKCFNKRRFVKDYLYIPENNVELKDGSIFNNQRGNSLIYIELNKEIPKISFEDNSNATATELNVCKNIESETNSLASMFYAASKQPNPNQYGQLDSGLFVKTHTCVIPINTTKVYESPVLAGGDCVIVQTSFQTRRQIFSQDITNQNNSDEFVFNYKAYRNLGYARFYYNNEPYELSNIVSKRPSEGKLPAQTHNLDCRKSSNKLFSVANEYMYTSVNGVVEYIVEADANLWFREQTRNPHYSSQNANLSEIFRSDRLQFSEEFKISPSFFKLETNQIFTEQQPKEVNKEEFRDKNAIIYSLPSTKGQSANNWRSFLANNTYSFDNLQFGNLVGIHALDMDRFIFLFDKSSPYISLGQSELQLSNETITLGDGGLFARKPRELMHTDVAYGCTQSSAFSSTPFGYYYPSASQGRLFKFSNNLEDVTKQGLHFWSKQFMPFRLKQYFPEYLEEENTICGIGYLTVYDNFYETLFLCKRDYVPVVKDITYNKVNKQFEYQGNSIVLSNTAFFKDVSWTLSYRPQNQGFISFHDWKPDAVVQTENHFMTIKGNSLWKHNDNCSLFSNFYGQDYSFEIAPIVSYGQNINVLNSFEYQLEGYHYINNCIDKYHVLNANFDRAQIFNSEQHSGMLNLLTRTEVTNRDIYDYPKIVNNFTTDIICIKKENKYRFNGFKNIVKDRGEISNLDAYIFKNDENGYTKSLYTINMDTSKVQTLFRHSYHEIWLAKEKCGRTQFIFKFLNSKITSSIR